MTDASDPRSIGEKLGALLADRERSAEDRTASRGILEIINHKLDGMLALPALFDAHEERDTQRFSELDAKGTREHAENSARLGKIEERLGKIEKGQALSAGARGAMKYLIGVLIAILGAIGAWWKFK